MEVEEPNREDKLIGGGRGVTELVYQKEGERHQRNLNENEQLREQIAEVSVRHKLWFKL